jgi:PKD repeat protein
MAKFIDRIASTDKGYLAGDLSIYPVAKDTHEQLYTASNNAQTITTQSTSYNSPIFVVEDTSSFPDQGLILIGTEQIYYSIKTANGFTGLKRGFAGSRQNTWPINTPVYGAVFAEPHNAIKDASINIEKNLGLIKNPDPKSLNGILTALETRFLSPRPVFRADPRTGVAPHVVSFQNFTESPAIRYFWDFGDGSTSQDFAPTHTYEASGNYSVSLTVITSLNGQGIATKKDYIKIGLQYAPAFFYTTPISGTVSDTFTFIDQSDGSIASRYWVWDDGTTTSITDPNEHTAEHQYTVAGTYNPSLLLVFSDETKNVVLATEPIIVGN